MDLSCTMEWPGSRSGTVGCMPPGKPRQDNFYGELCEVAEKMLQLLSYGPKDPFAYNYNDACTAFARGEAVMYPIGSYAVPQIQSVNPDMEIDSFVFPGSDKKEENTLNSGIDLQFCVTKECKNKEAAYEVLDFLLEDENVQDYLNEQNSVPCKEGEFELSPMLDGVRQYIEEENMADYQDHYYPSEMAVDAQIQTLLIDKDVDAFLKKFDKDWQRYNRDIIQKVQKYEAEQTHSNRESEMSMKKMNERKRTFLLMTIPVVALFFCFNTLPLLKGVMYSFTNFKGFGSYDWVGVRNYMDLFQDVRVGNSYWFTFKLAIVTTIVVNVISLLLAMALNSKIRAKSFFRGAYFLPNILGALVVGYIFNYFFTYILPAVGEMIGWETLSSSLLSSKNLAWIAIVIVCAWQAIAMNTIIYISACRPYRRMCMKQAQ